MISVCASSYEDRRIQTLGDDTGKEAPVCAQELKARVPSDSSVIASKFTTPRTSYFDSNNTIIQSISHLMPCKTLDENPE